MPRSAGGRQKDGALLTVLCMTSYGTCTEIWEVGGSQNTGSALNKSFVGIQTGKVDLCAKIDRNCNTEWDQ